MKMNMRRWKIYVNIDYMIEEYTKAKKAGEREVRRARSEGKDPYLTVLNEILPEVDTMQQIHVGIREIPLRMIAGTKTSGRANAFARNFMPIMRERTELAIKWSNLYDAQIDEGIRDPIQVFEYMLHFYVQEGNKRVSVLKYLDVPSIEADITRIMPKESDSPEYQVYQEFLEFFACVPIYDIVFTRPGSYRQFAFLVHQDLKHPWDSDFINVVRGAYFRFYSVFVKKGGNDLPITPGDAFLLYLEVYRFDSLLDCSRGDIEERLNQVWKEVLLKTKDVKISLIKEPLEEGKRSFLIGPIYNENHPLRVLFIHAKDPAKDAWEQFHENGRLYLDRRFHGMVKTSSAIAAPQNGSAMRLPEDVKNYDVVFTTHRELMKDTLRVALKYPQVRFFNCSIFLNYQSITGYFGRMYEAMFLLGRMAAHACENHKVGYVVNMPGYGRMSEINAFAIGAALVDPQVKVYLVWSNAIDGKWLEVFQQNDVKVYAGPVLEDDQANEAVHGVRKMTEQGPQILAIPVWNWNLYYEKILQMILDRKWDKAKMENGGAAMNCWWGMDTGVIDVKIDPTLDWIATKDVNIWRQLFMNNAWNPFSGELRSQNGVIQPEGTKCLSSEEIIAMNWLNHNVVGSIPEVTEMNEDTKELAEMNSLQGKHL